MKTLLLLTTSIALVLSAFACSSSDSDDPKCAKESLCAGECVDLATDAQNCGACGKQCSAGQSCRAGSCESGGAGNGNGTAGSSAQGGSGGASGSGATGGSGGSGGRSVPNGELCSSAFLSSEARSKYSDEYQAWKRARVKDCPETNSAVVSNGGGVFSEGIGYGMLLAASNDDQALFDKLWKFYTDHLDAKGLMNWQMGECAAPGNNNANAATDADLDAAMALIQADARWGGYRQDAADLIAKIKEHETDVCDGLNVLRPGDMFGGCRDGGNGRVNPSYFAPGYYRVFATIDTANAAFWEKLADDSYVLLSRYQEQMDGLVPEWAYVDGRLEGGYDYNACRTPWRVATDYLWFCTPEAKTFLEPIVAYVKQQGGVASVPFAKNSAFLGAFAVAATIDSQSEMDAFVSSWLGAEKDDTPYFQATLRVLYLQTAAGAFPSGL